MGKLTAKSRAALPAKAFAGPGRSYPVEDKAHSVAAKGRATQAMKAGRMTPAQAAAIDRKANRVLARGGRGG